MSHSLPLELQFKVLSYLAIPGFASDDTSEVVFSIFRDHLPFRSALITCCLVCGAWLPICQRMLLHTVYLSSYDQFKGFCDRLSSTGSPISAHTTSLALLSEFDTHNDKPFYHLAPLFLMTKLPFLQRLWIWGGCKIKTPFVVRSVLTMHLNNFQAVTFLGLRFLKFQSFWDFRRLVVAFPNLIYLTLEAVMLHNLDPFQQHGRIPSLGPGAQKLMYLSFDTCFGWDPLWLWVVSRPPQHRHVQNVRPYPMLSLCDIQIIRGTSERGNFNSSIKWEHNDSEGQQHCRLQL